MALFLSALSSLLVGALLIVAPWSVLWEGNVLPQSSPWLRSLMMSTLTRGAVSGLGFVNVLLAVDEARQLLRRPQDRAV